jgi:hypothetical protein
VGEGRYSGIGSAVWSRSAAAVVGDEAGLETAVGTPSSLQLTSSVIANTNRNEENLFTNYIVIDFPKSETGIF